MSLRVVDKAWQIVVDQCIDGLVKGGSLLVHGGNDISYDKADALREILKAFLILISAPPTSHFAGGGSYHYPHSPKATLL